MSRSVHSSFVGALVLSLALAGCDDPAGPEAAPGSVTFDFQTSAEVAFDVEGAVRFRRSGALVFRTWAAGAHPSSGLLEVGAFRAGAAPEGDLFVLNVPGVSGPATVELRQECEVAGCAEGTLVFGAELEPGFPTEDRRCRFTTGTVRVESIGRRARGTFSGGGTCFGPSGSEPFTVRDGTFDVPVVRGFRITI